MNDLQPYMSEYNNLSAFFNQRPGGQQATSNSFGQPGGQMPWDSMSSWQGPGTNQSMMWDMGDGASMMNPLYGSSLQGQQVGGTPGQVGSPGSQGGSPSMGQLQGYAQGFNSMAQYGQAGQDFMKARGQT